MKKRKKKLYFKTEQEFKESLIKTPKTQLSAIALAVRYNTRAKEKSLDELLIKKVITNG